MYVPALCTTITATVSDVVSLITTIVRYVEQDTQTRLHTTLALRITPSNTPGLVAVILSAFTGIRNVL